MAENCRFRVIAGHLIHYSIREIPFDGLSYELCCLMVTRVKLTELEMVSELNYFSFIFRPKKKRDLRGITLLSSSITPLD